MSVRSHSKTGSVEIEIEVHMRRVTPADIEGFDSYELGSDDDRRVVYTSGGADRPAVVLLHELPGMVPECIDLARHLSGPHDGHDGYQVHMPLLFGTPGESPSLLNMARYAWCMRREIHLFKSGTTSPITAWLARVVDEATSRSGSERVAVIGMCLTGGLVFGLLTHANVRAVIASQPSAPSGIFSEAKKRDLGLSEDDLRDNFGTGKPIMALRYRDDWRCPRLKMEGVADAAGVTLPQPPDNAIQDVQLGNIRVVDIPGKEHAVLTLSLHADTYTEVRKFLWDNLG
jgi:dienelactone hydrolase